jgi:hypothetical protein
MALPIVVTRASMTHGNAKLTRRAIGALSG